MSFISNNIIPWKNSTLIISKKHLVYFKFRNYLSTNVNFYFVDNFLCKSKYSFYFFDYIYRSTQQMCRTNNKCTQSKFKI